MRSRNAVFNLMMECLPRLVRWVNPDVAVYESINVVNRIIIGKRAGEGHGHYGFDDGDGIWLDVDSDELIVYTPTWRLPTIDAIQSFYRPPGSRRAPHHDGNRRVISISDPSCVDAILDEVAKIRRTILYVAGDAGLIHVPDFQAEYSMISKLLGPYAPEQPVWNVKGVNLLEFLATHVGVIDGRIPSGGHREGDLREAFQDLRRSGRIPRCAGTRKQAHGTV